MKVVRYEAGRAAFAEAGEVVGPRLWPTSQIKSSPSRILHVIHVTGSIEHTRPGRADRGSEHVPASANERHAVPNILSSSEFGAWHGATRVRFVRSSDGEQRN